MISNQSKGRFQNSIVDWFEKSARDLPWRHTSDPYRIWISEIMLQQTTVATVIPYYERFLKKFPTLQKLAATNENDVLHLWQGLGYYRRAKNLREGARLIVKEFGGKFPETREDLLKVPGIGAYSSGAILSIAFRKRAAALDGNLIRVYARFFHIQDPVNETKTLKKLWEIAEAHTPDALQMARGFCEGMMELGATVCTPRNPKCGECPLRWGCQAVKAGDAENLPIKRFSRAREKFWERVYIDERKGQIAFMKKGSDPKFPDFLRLPFKSLRRPPQGKASLKYSVTHRDFSVFVERKKLSASAQLIWKPKAQLTKILLPAIDRKILAGYTADS